MFLWRTGENYPRIITKDSSITIPLIIAHLITENSRICQQTEKALTRQASCAGWAGRHCLYISYGLSFHNVHQILQEHLNLVKCQSQQHQMHYENMPIQIHWKFYHQKMAIFQIKNSDIFHISAQNIDCGYSLELPRWGGSNEYPQSIFLSQNNKNNVYPCKPQFYYIKVGFKGVKII